MHMPMTSGGAAAEEAGHGRRHGGVHLDNVVHVHHAVLREAGHTEEVVERVAAAVVQRPRAHLEPILGAHVAPHRRAVSSPRTRCTAPRTSAPPRRGGELLHMFTDALNYPTHLGEFDIVRQTSLQFAGAID
jgi:hypothetical protein